MATLGTNAFTLNDWARQIDPNGKTAKVVEVLNQRNRILDDAIFVEGNLPTGHKSTIRSGLPTVAWRLLNYGVQPSKPRSVQVTDSCGMLEAWAQVDESIAKLNGNTAEFRFSQDKAFIEAMNIEFAQTFFYGNTGTDPEEFMGLAPRYNVSGAENDINIIRDASGTGSDNTSIWLIVWSPETVFCIFPKGQITGLQHDDLGLQRLEDSQTPPGYYMGYLTHYKWDVGLVVADWRYVVRICDIDVSELTYDAATGANLVDLMIQAMELPPSLEIGNPVFYCNRTVKSFLHRQAVQKTNVQLSYRDVFGKPVLMAGDIPIKRCDQITNAEATVL